MERCYTTEEAARATCPLDKDIAKKKFKEIILFREYTNLLLAYGRREVVDTVALAVVNKNNKF